MGNLIINESKRFEVISETGWTDTLTCGSGASLYFNNNWVAGFIEADEGGYYFSAGDNLGKIYLNESLTMRITK